MTGKRSEESAKDLLELLRGRAAALWEEKGLLGERVGRHRWAAVVAGFLGVLVILRPGFASPNVYLLIPLFGYLVTLGFTAPNAMANALAHQGARAGSASALIGTLQFGVATVSSALVGLFGAGSALPMAAVIAGCGLLAYGAHRTLVGSGTVAEFFPSRP